MVKVKSFKEMKYSHRNLVWEGPKAYSSKWKRKLWVKLIIAAEKKIGSLPKKEHGRFNAWATPWPISLLRKRITIAGFQHSDSQVWDGLLTKRTVEQASRSSRNWMQKNLWWCGKLGPLNGCQVRAANVLEPLKTCSSLSFHFFGKKWPRDTWTFACPTGAINLKRVSENSRTIEKKCGRSRPTCRRWKTELRGNRPVSKDAEKPRVKEEMEYRWHAKEGREIGLGNDQFEWPLECWTRRGRGKTSAFRKNRWTLNENGGEEMDR